MSGYVSVDGLRKDASLPNYCFLTADEAAELLNTVNTAHERLLAEMERVPEACWHCVFTEVSGWSASNMVEHVILSEAALLHRINAADYAVVRLELVSGMMLQEELLRKLLPSEGRATAAASLATFSAIERDTAGDSLKASEKRFGEVVASLASLPVKAVTWPHKIFGELSAYLWLQYIPLHSMRHANQLHGLASWLSERKPC